MHAHVDIPVARLPTSTWLPLSVSVVHGRLPGPTICICSAIHGDELNGIPIIRNVIHQLDPQEVAGTILAVPIVNAFGIVSGSRYLPDRRDLNRSFPGSKRGSLAGQLAHLFLEQVVRGCDYLIDLHTGSQGRTNLPQIRCNLDDERVRPLAEAFAPPVIIHSKPIPGSLRRAAGRMGVCVLLYETGEDQRFDKDGIRIGTDGCLRVLRKLGTIDTDLPDAPTQPLYSRTTHWARASRSGMCEMRVGLGDRIRKGQRIAVVFDALTRGEKPVRARVNGLIIGHLNHGIVNRGEAVAHIAEIEGNGGRAG